MTAKRQLSFNDRFKLRDQLQQVELSRAGIVAENIIFRLLAARFYLSDGRSIDYYRGAN
jgi:hypothetical protein